MQEECTSEEARVDARVARAIKAAAGNGGKGKGADYRRSAADRPTVRLMQIGGASHMFTMPPTTMPLKSRKANAGIISGRAVYSALQIALLHIHDIQHTLLAVRAGTLVRMWGHTLYHIDDLTAGPYAPGLSNFGDVFTPFREKVEKSCTVRKGAGLIAWKGTDRVMKIV